MGDLPPQASAEEKAAARAAIEAEMHEIGHRRSALLKRPRRCAARLTTTRRTASNCSGSQRRCGPRSSSTNCFWGGSLFSKAASPKSRGPVQNRGDPSSQASRSPRLPCGVLRAHLDFRARRRARQLACGFGEFALLLVRAISVDTSARGFRVTQQSAIPRRRRSRSSTTSTGQYIA
jgi:hypothetical protein